MSDLGASARFATSFGYRRFLKPGRKAPGFFVRSEQNVYPVDYQAEHLPNRESRVLLANERDSLGMLRARTALKFSHTDIHNVGRAMTVLDESLRRASVGYVKLLHEDVDEGVSECLQQASGFHQTGTTRMAATAAQGVVDSNLAVFGADNLFVASTSVLPTFQPGESDAHRRGLLDQTGRAPTPVARVAGESVDRGRNFGRELDSPKGRFRR